MTRPIRTLSQEEFEEIREKYLFKDISVLSLCKEYGVDKIALFKWLKEAGVTAKKKERRTNNRLALQKDYLLGEYSLLELSVKYNTSTNAVRTYLFKQGIFKPSINMSNRQYNKRSEIEYEGVFKLSKNNGIEYDGEFIEWLKENSARFQSLNDLAIKLGTTQKGLKKIVDVNGLELKFNVSLNKFSADYKAPYQDREWLVERFVKERKSIAEVASEYGFTERVVQKWRSFHKDYLQEQMFLEIGERPEKTTGEKKVVKGAGKPNAVRDVLSREKLTPPQESLIKASMLGDGHITNESYIPVFIVSHAENQKDYLYWKYEILENLCNFPPKRTEGSKGAARGREFNKQPSYRINTRKLLDLERIRDMSKSEIIEGLDEFQLSVYLLDDGYRANISWELSVAGLTITEQDLLKDVLRLRFGVDVTIKKSRQSFYIPARFRDEIDNIILNNIPNNLDVVKYKILDKRRTN